jgi:hypothetical protein
MPTLRFQDLSKEEKILYYQNSPFFSLREYPIRRIIRDNCDLNDICNHLCRFDWFENIIYIGPSTRVKELILCYNNATDIRVKYHIRVIILSQFQSLEFLIHRDQTASNYQNFKYLFDFGVQERLEILILLSTCYKRLTFDLKEFPDFCLYYQDKYNGCSRYVNLFKNTQFFKFTGNQKQRGKTPYNKQVKNATKSFEIRSSKTINKIITNANEQLIGEALQKLHIDTITGVEKCVTPANMVKFQKSLSIVHSKNTT